MHEKRIRNIVLAIVATLLLLNLGVMLAPAVHAIPKTHYKAVGVYMNGPNPTDAVQQALDQQSAQGWEYVSDVGGILIFKK